MTAGQGHRDPRTAERPVDVRRDQSARLGPSATTFALARALSDGPTTESTRKKSRPRKWVSGAHRPAADDDANERGQRRQTRCALSSGKQHRCSAAVATTMRNAVATFALLLVLGATAWAEDEKEKEGLGYVMAFPMEEPKPSGGRVETVVVESSKAEDLRQVLGAYKAATRLRQRQQQPPQPLPPPMQRMPPPDQKPPLLLLVVHAPRPSGPAPFRAGPPMPGPPPGFLQGPPPAPHPGMNPYGMAPAPPVGPAQVQMPAPPTAHPSEIPGSSRLCPAR
ncbi:hypothetical protein MTO96_049586 [Rhipicephalus appendiculatus]